MLPDEPGTKVNQCVDNIMQIWRDGETRLKNLENLVLAR